MHSLVIPERTALTFVRSTAEHQAASIVIGVACPACGCGLVAYGDAICERCTAEADRERIAADCAVARREAHERVIAAEGET